MASIVDLRWTNSQELLADLDLDLLYVRQLQAIGGSQYKNYPYVLLLHTGKIMIGIDLGYSAFIFRDFGAGIRASGAACNDAQRDSKAIKETHE
jgi:hypothetical protein